MGGAYEVSTREATIVVAEGIILEILTPKNPENGLKCLENNKLYVFNYVKVGNLSIFKAWSYPHFEV